MSWSITLGLCVNDACQSLLQADNVPVVMIFDLDATNDW